MATIAKEGLEGYPSPGNIAGPENQVEYIKMQTPEAVMGLGSLAAQTAFEELSIALGDIEGVTPGSPTARTSVTSPKTIWHSKTEPDKMSASDTRGSD
jgi:hypothetical protein